MVGCSAFQLRQSLSFLLCFPVSNHTTAVAALASKLAHCAAHNTTCSSSTYEDISQPWQRCTCMRHAATVHKPRISRQLTRSLYTSQSNTKKLQTRLAKQRSNLRPCTRPSRPHKSRAQTHAPETAHSLWPSRYTSICKLARSLDNPSSNYNDKTTVVIHHTTQPVKPQHIQLLIASASSSVCRHCRLPSCLEPRQQLLMQHQVPLGHHPGGSDHHAPTALYMA